MAAFDDPKVGMASGTTLLLLGGKLVSERYTSYHVPGQAKFYRRDVFPGYRRTSMRLRLGHYRRNRCSPPRLAYPQRTPNYLHPSSPAGLQFRRPPGTNHLGSGGLRHRQPPPLRPGSGHLSPGRTPLVGRGIGLHLGFFYQLFQSGHPAPHRSRPDPLPAAGAALPPHTWQPSAARGRSDGELLRNRQYPGSAGGGLHHGHLAGPDRGLDRGPGLRRGSWRQCPCHQPHLPLPRISESPAPGRPVVRRRRLPDPGLPLFGQLICRKS